MVSREKYEIQHKIVSKRKVATIEGLKINIGHKLWGIRPKQTVLMLNNLLLWDTYKARIQCSNKLPTKYNIAHVLISRKLIFYQYVFIRPSRDSKSK